MIFLTVGTQEPFRRLVETVDKWASQQTDQPHIVAQIGKSDYIPKAFSEVYPFLSPEQYESFFDNAKLIVSHAGVGTIMRCMEAQKPLIIMPRSAALNEHRNDHQLNTIKGLNNILTDVVVKDETELLQKLREEKYYPPKTANKENLKGFCQKLTNIILDED